MTSATDCPNCGAPKRGAVCEYCGTHFAHYQGQAIVDVEPDFVDIRTWDGATCCRIYNAPNVTVKVVNE